METVKRSLQDKCGWGREEFSGWRGATQREQWIWGGEVEDRTGKWGRRGGRGKCLVGGLEMGQGTVGYGKGRLEIEQCSWGKEDGKGTVELGEWMGEREQWRREEM